MCVCVWRRVVAHHTEPAEAFLCRCVPAAAASAVLPTCCPPPTAQHSAMPWSVFSLTCLVSCHVCLLPVLRVDVLAVEMVPGGLRVGLVCLHAPCVLCGRRLTHCMLMNSSCSMCVRVGFFQVGLFPNHQSIGGGFQLVAGMSGDMRSETGAGGVSDASVCESLMRAL